MVVHDHNEWPIQVYNTIHIPQGFIYFRVLLLFGSFYPLGIMEPFLPRHNDLFLASLSAVPHVSSIFFKSHSKVFLRVIFGLPCFLLPGGFHLKPFLGILFCSILSTCPSHLCLLCLTSVAILQHSVLAYSLSFEIVHKKNHKDKNFSFSLFYKSLIILCTDLQIS